MSSTFFKDFLKKNKHIYNIWCSLGIMRLLFRKIHQSWLVVAACLGILSGTILAFFFRIEFFSSGIWVAFVVLVFLFGYLRPNRMFFIFIFLSGIILAMFRTGIDLSGEKFIQQFTSETVTVSGKVTEDPDVDEGSEKLRLSELKINGVETRGTLFVQLAKREENLKRSDIVSLSGKISEGFGSFSGTMFRPEILEISRPEPGDFFLSLRDWLAEKVQRNIPERESQLGLGYLLGMKNSLGDDIIEALKIVGLTHLVVASGTHLGIIVEIVRRIFGKLSRAAGLIFSLLFVFIFGGIVGWTASILRAAIVTILTLLAGYVGRKFEAWRILLLAAAITLLINPTFLTNLGWLLSFAAFSGILILAPILQKIFFGEEKPKKLAEIVLATVSAQILCLPILIFFFGSFSIISILLNVLILPTIPFAMGLTFLSGTVPILGGIFGKLATILLRYHLLLVDFFSEQKMFLIQIPPENPLIFLAYLPILVLIIVFSVRQQKSSPRLEELF